MNTSLKQYLVITCNYWAFTLTDGAIRMLVLFYFYQLGYSALEVATLFILYELMGVVTNLVGGWLGANYGLNRTMNVGLGLQVIALLMLTVPDEYLGVLYVMLAQALSGVAKDLNKMSAKSSVKLLADQVSGQLYKWVAVLTGSKNTLKGVGFFLGAALLEWIGFRPALYLMAGMLFLVLIASLFWLQSDLGKAKQKSKFKSLFSTERALNWLAAARLFLFAARDVWFVVAVPLYLESILGWSFSEVGAFMAFWIIGYGFIQAATPRLTQKITTHPDHKLAFQLALILGLVTAAIALWTENAWWLVGGLLVFGMVFALNSAVHSYLVVAMAREDGVSKDVGFYYMANAGGRLMGTLLSGWLYQQGGISLTLWCAAGLILASALLVREAKT